MDRNTKKRTQHYTITLWWSSNAYKIKFAQQEGYYNTLYYIMLETKIQTSSTGVDRIGKLLIVDVRTTIGMKYK